MENKENLKKELLVYFLWALIATAGIWFAYQFYGLIVILGATKGIISIIVFILLAIALRALFAGRISGLFVHSRFVHSIGQMPSVIALLRLNFSYNYKGNKYTHGMKKFIAKDARRARRFFEKTKVKEFTTKTNNKVFHQLQELERKKIIKLIKVEEPKIGIEERISGKLFKDIGNQPLEKLLLFGFLTTLINCRNKKYWDFIKRPENVNYYKIIVLKNEGN